MKSSSIHNLDTLEKEILRLKLRQKDAEHKLDKQWGKARSHFGSMLWNSFRRKKDETKESPGFFESLVQNDIVEDTIHRFSEKISGKLADVVSHLFERFFKK
ncbi:MAG: hypothetical protein IPQ08_13720 [Chitinophagaceae bacterium]|nr:hypothetical protein [Chitinophagaceae bacterium]